MSIFKESLRDYVRQQIFLREKIISRGNGPDIGSFSRLDGVDYTNITLNPSQGTVSPFKLDPGAFYSYQQKQCVLRMSSLVDLMEDVGLDFGSRFENYRGESFGRNFILQGGVLSDFERRIEKEENTERFFQRLDARGGFPNPKKKVNLSYGDPSLAADPSDGYGVVPMPGIIDANIRTTSAYGSLRQAKVNFVCHNLRQLDILEILYMRPGYPVVLEWGWSPYIANDGTIVNDLPSVSDNDWFWNDKTVSEQLLHTEIVKTKEFTGGNYDGFIGYVTNFNYTARADGGFDCSTELVSMGECIDSLKVPTYGYSNTYRYDKTEGDDAIYGTSLGYIIRNLKILSEEIDLPWYKDTAAFFDLIENQETREEKQRAVAFEKLVNLLGSFEAAKDCIIRKDRNITNSTGESINTQYSYIKLEALVELINSEVIPKTEKGDPTVILSTKQFIPQKDGKIRIEPITYVEYESDQELLDVSCSAKTCILPHQWLYFRDSERNLSNLERVGLGMAASSLVGASITAFGINELLGLTRPEGFEFTDVLEFATAAWSGEKDVFARGKNLKVNQKMAERFIGNLFINVEVIDSVYKQVFSQKDGTLGKFFKQLFNKINAVCPMHNFGLITDTEYTNIVNIVDLPITTKDLKLKDIYYEDLFQFKVLSNDTIVRDFRYSTQIPSALKSTIAIQAQSGASADDLDSVTFAAFNKGIKSRLHSYSKKFSDTETDNYSSATDGFVDKTNRLAKLKRQLRIYTENFFNNLEEDGQNDQYSSISKNIKSIVKEAQTLQTFVTEVQSGFIQAQSVVPIDLNLILDGISGIVIGSVFRVDESRLPKAYKNNVAFVCLGEEQQITAGQDWTTNLRGQMLMVPNAPTATIGVDVKYNPNKYIENLDVQAERKVAKGLSEFDDRFDEELYKRYVKANDDLLAATMLKNRYHATLSKYPDKLPQLDSLIRSTYQNIIMPEAFAYLDLIDEITSKGLDVGDYQDTYQSRETTQGINRAGLDLEDLLYKAYTTKPTPETTMTSLLAGPFDRYTYKQPYYDAYGFTSWPPDPKKDKNRKIIAPQWLKWKVPSKSQGKVHIIKNDKFVDEQARYWARINGQNPTFAAGNSRTFKTNHGEVIIYYNKFNILDKDISDIIASGARPFRLFKDGELNLDIENQPFNSFAN